ncbi:MAG: bifunctional oligoribonuclease/PAP phosphatase NrnA [Clostridia bacterium]|nr:bifunctional oligoribonuclease/PAP phosphatase NrnA [Clostridia bacterium]
MSNNSCNDITLSKAAKFLKKHDNYIILTHSSPDGDTLGSAYAIYYGLKEMGKIAEILCPDEIPKKYSYFAVKTERVTVDSPTVISVDLADEKLLGGLEERFRGKIQLAIDHHISNTRFAENLLLDSNAAAACEIIYELLGALKVYINDVTAKALYTGIATDTGCFKYSNVTAKTHIIASELFCYDINAAEINRLMFDTKSKRLLQLERMVLDTAEYHFDDKCIMLTVTDEMQKETGCSGTDLEGIAVISRSIEGILVGITIKQNGDREYKLSLRTFEPLDASEICKSLGGGGHKRAAGVTLSGTLEEVKNTILAEVRDNMEKANVRASSDK